MWGGRCMVNKKDDKMEVKIRFGKDETELWNMVKKHSCRSGFVKDVLKWYSDKDKKENPSIKTDFSGIF